MLSRFDRKRTGYAVLIFALLLGVALMAGAIGGNGTSRTVATKGGQQAAMPAGANTGAASGATSDLFKAGKPTAGGAVVATDVAHDVSPPLRDIKPAPDQPARVESAENELPNVKMPQGHKDTVVQDFFGPLAMPTPIVQWAGIGNPTGCGGCLPPDTQGDVGPNHYIQWVNTKFQIWDKSGTSMYGPVNGNTLWTGFSGTCATQNAGDPVTLYDPLANRWFMAQFTTSAPYSQCLAVSTTADPLGTWNRYQFNQLNPATDFGDYPKYGVWPDAYYGTANIFVNNNATGVQIMAYDRAAMLAGNTATQVIFEIPGYFYALLPADVDGTTPPPAGSPNYLISGYGSSTELYFWKFHVDFATPANSTFTGPIFVPVAPFDPDLCSYARNCIPQPSTSAKLDTLPVHTMHRLAYRNFGYYESLVTNESVDVNGADHVGIRWYEFRNPSGTPYVYQQGTYSPDSDHRWMGSIAMDKSGNIALGYSVSSSTTYPSIRYTGRLNTDPLGVMAQGETTLIAGTGSQTSSSSRWGDYSMMAVDPTDDCTFWYTNEYYATTSNSNWQTRIGSFKFPGCGAPPPTPTPGGPTATPIPPATPTACANYTMTQGTGTIEAGTTRIDGTGCDDCLYQVTLPFPLRLYERSFTAMNVSSNGSLQFITGATTNVNDCLPAPVFNYAVIPYWDDIVEDCANCGIYTGITGTAPNRTYLVEYRAQNWAGNLPVNFEIKFHENTNAFEIVYGTVQPGTSDFTAGVQRDMGAYTQIVCNSLGPVVSGTMYSFTQPCGLITPTPTTGPAITNTPTRTNTPQPTNTTGPSPTVTPGGCNIAFADVPPSHTFYAWVICLACNNVVNGYTCGGPGEPCNGNNDPYFRPGANITRAQIAKIVTLAADITTPIPSGQQTFQDVAPDTTFWIYIERLAGVGAMQGYDCGGVGEPCVAPDNRPYFRQNALATRGQLTKIVSQAAGYTDPIPAGTQTFQDVPEGSTFHEYVERLLIHNPNAMSGYDCGGPGEPCVGPQNRPYFRPANNVTRGQASKIVASIFYPSCGQTR